MHSNKYGKLYALHNEKVECVGQYGKGSGYSGEIEEI